MKKNHQAEVLVAVILATALMCYFALTYLVKPMREQTAETEAAVLAEESALKATYFTVASYDSKKAELRDVANGIKKYCDVFYSDTDEKEHLDHLNKNLKDCKVTFTSFSATTGSYKASAVYDGVDAAGKIFALLSGDSELKGSSLLKEDVFNTFYAGITGKNGRLENDVHTITMNVEVLGTFKSTMEYVKNILENGKSIVCSSLSFSAEENAILSAPADPVTSLTMTLTFVDVPEVPGMCSIPDPGALTPYAFPQNIIDGSYRGF